jgi:hypothetical protein
MKLTKIDDMGRGNVVTLTTGPCKGLNCTIVTPDYSDTHVEVQFNNLENTSLIKKTNQVVPINE